MNNDSDISGLEFYHQTKYFSTDNNVASAKSNKLDNHVTRYNPVKTQILQ